MIHIIFFHFSIAIDAFTVVKQMETCTDSEPHDN